MYNSRYVPPNATRRSFPQPTNQKPGPHQQSYQQLNDDNYDFTFNANSNDPYDMSITPRQNDNRGLNHPQPTTQKRVQIIDHNRQTPSTDHLSGRDSHNSYQNYTPEIHQTQQKPKSRHDYIDDNKSDGTFPSVQRPNNFKIHEYLYGLSAPDPGLCLI